MSLNTGDYGSVLGPLVEWDELAPLGPGAPNEEAREDLLALSFGRAFSSFSVSDSDMAACCVSGIFLRHNYMDESHTLSQDIHTTSGSYWHGIMHRREPDYGNASYWFRQVRRHAIWPALVCQAHDLAKGSGVGGEADFLCTQKEWDPYAFVDFCSRVYRRNNDAERLAINIQQLEWELLFDYCFRQAVA